MLNNGTQKYLTIFCNVMILIAKQNSLHFSLYLMICSELLESKEIRSMVIYLIS